MEAAQPKSKSELKKACINCGAELLYAPGTTELQCEYCGHSETITAATNSFEELELRPYLEELGHLSHSEVISLIQCKNCGANQHIEENYKSLHCVYCSMPLIIEDQQKEAWILPGALVPFQLTKEKAHSIFKTWVKKLWFAPNKLKKAALDPQFTKGLYVPYWTFDAQLYATYTGQRGDYYYVSVPYTTTVNGKTVTRMRQERRTRWTPASGSISGFVDDTIVGTGISGDHCRSEPDAGFGLAETPHRRGKRSSGCRCHFGLCRFEYNGTEFQETPFETHR